MSVFDCYGMSKWQDIFALFDDGLSILQARILLLLQTEIAETNHRRSNQHMEMTNIVRDISVDAIAAEVHATSAEVLDALFALDAGNWLEWVQVAGGENAALGECHAYKMHDPSDWELAEQHRAMRDRRRAEVERLLIEGEVRERRKLAKAAKEVAE